ncbi:uncharacterized protein LOC124830456 [Vigna umbellata]|uniref:uncharacterized protein LOC124830456 n=1 Tax=Vigna umbellata TaxID=87088 RepID=UPI001F5E417E|nr:uncharacterized protein LOC124830456 [Vigna umbellata]
MDSNPDPFKAPDQYFLNGTAYNVLLYSQIIVSKCNVSGDSQEKFLKFCVPLHKYGLEGNWTEAKVILDKDKRLEHAAITSGWSTLLHVAAGANHVHFVEELLQVLSDEHIDLRDSKGNTAFCFAVASGNMRIVELLLKRNPHLPRIRGGGGHTPLKFALMQGKCYMAQFLYDKTEEVFEDLDRRSLFFTCVETGNYHMALQMAREWPNLAWERDQNNDTALHLLALNKNPMDSCCHSPQLPNPIKINPGMNQLMIFQLVKYLWKTMLCHKTLSEAIEIISEPYQLLFDAAEVGNFGFLSELISAHPSLIWEVDNKNQSIIHTAVLFRHASIFNLIHEIGCQKDLILTYIVKEDNPSFSLPKIKNNNLLHLAAKLAPPDQLELVSGAALQMCLEIIWFEEVKKIMPQSYVIMKNSDGLTAQELFTTQHEGLRKKGEEWMKRTAEFCILISTVIATAVFSAAINIPGGIDYETKKPNFLNQTSFLLFAISDGAAFISSSTAILIFLSILMSRYAEYDFYKSLPLKLISGLITLFISIACMMVAFGSAFFITYNYGSRVIPDSIAVLVCPPLLLYIALQFSLWSDIIYSTFYCRTLFRPTKRMIYTIKDI